MIDAAKFKPKTVYVIYIAATPERVWQALTSSEFTRRYFWDRAIEIEMKRKLVTESVKRLRRRDGADLNEIARKLARWSLDSIDKLRTAEAKMPRGLTIAPRTPGSRWLPSPT